MEIHIQKCQSCHSRSLRNILVRGEKQSVFVQCRDCNALVARYIIAKSGYFHVGKGFESFLRSLERDGDVLDARDINDKFVKQEQEVLDNFKGLTPALEKQYGDELP